MRVLQDQRPCPCRAHADVPKAEEWRGAEVAEQQHRRGRIPGRRIPVHAPPALLQVVSGRPRSHGSRPALGGLVPDVRVPPPSQNPGIRTKIRKPETTKGRGKSRFCFGSNICPPPMAAARTALLAHQSASRSPPTATKEPMTERTLPANGTAALCLNEGLAVTAAWRGDEKATKFHGLAQK